MLKEYQLATFPTYDEGKSTLMMNGNVKIIRD
jgi:hypothetical protein